MRLDLSDSYHRLFIEETGEQLELLENALLGLEKESDDESVNRLFRAAHSIKGAAATMEFDGMVAIAHELETILSEIREKKRLLDGEVVATALSLLDRLKDVFNDLVEGKESSSKGTLTVVFEDDAILLSVKAYMIIEAIGSSVKIIGTVPDDYENSEDEAFNGEFRLVVESAGDGSGIRKALERITDIKSHTYEPEGVQRPETKTETTIKTRLKTETKTEMGTGAVTPRHVTSDDLGAPKESAAKKSVERSTVRVTNEKINELMNLIGELTIDKEILADVGKSLKKKYPKDKDVIRLLDVHAHVSQLNGFLQELALSTRLVPIERLFNKFPRVVWDISAKCGKSVELIMSGQQTGIDRSLMEAIVDPINHILRNAIDHGMESPAERLSSGKPERGSIQLKAAHHENRVIITIADDGRGIDPERIRRMCIENGMVSGTDAALISDDEIIRWIFKPGFSTASVVSDISGRGVGLDVVLSTVRSMGGVIDIKSQKGSGSTFTIELPLTMAIMQAMLVKEEQYVFAVPVTGIIELIRVKGCKDSGVSSMGGRETFEWRGQILPVVSLSEHFNIRSDMCRDEWHIMVLNHGESHVAFKVERVTGEQEIVLKSIGEYIGERKILGPLKGISGVSTLGDGRTALIVDLAYIFQCQSDT